MADPLDGFADLPYPGGRPPANRPAPAPTEEAGWDDKPVVMLHRGAEREFFTIGHLAKALSRSTVTIRSWENKGVFPRSPLSTPKSQVVPNFGSKPVGRRLYTREQIEGVLEICRQCRVITDPHQKPPSPEFTKRVTALFLEIRDRETTPSPEQQRGTQHGQ